MHFEWLFLNTNTASLLTLVLGCGNFLLAPTFELKSPSPLLFLVLSSDLRVPPGLPLITKLVCRTVSYHLQLVLDPEICLSEASRV